MARRLPAVRPVLGAGLILAALGGAPAPAGAAERSAALRAVPGEVVVGFAPGASATRRAAVRADVDVRAVRALRLPGTQLVRTDGAPVAEAIRELEARPEVRYAEPNYVYRATAITDDPHFERLWGLRNTGQTVLGTTGLAGADAGVAAAWDRFTGAQETLVAVADTGIAYDHPDLAANVWANPGEVAGDGADNDGNGFVDDVRGYDFAERDGDPRDLQGHGTHVAGTIAAVGGNGLGISGVTQRARLMAVRVLGADGSGSLSDIADGFDYAGDEGARIVNASLGGPGSSQLLHDVIASHPNTLYVVAAGNETTDVDAAGAASFPCNDTSANLVCVAATDQLDRRAGFSNTGALSVDLGAPGVNVLSSVPAWDTVYSEGFETDLAGRWTTSGTWARTTERRAAGVASLADSPGAPYANGTVSSARSAVIDLRGRTGCVLSYALALDTQTNRDLLRVKVSRDGWATARTIETGSGSTSGDFVDVDLGLGSDGARVQVGFELATDASVTADGAWIDDVVVRCARVGANAYAYLSGTSMATPHVAGAAALIFGRRPEATVAEMRGWLLETGKPLPALSGVTVTGRRLDVAWALAAALDPPPVPIATAATGATVTDATLNGTVDPRGAETSFEFEYGPTAAYGRRAAATPAGGSQSGPQPVSLAVGGLAAETTYHYRVVAVRGHQRFASAGATFTTPRAATQAVEPAPTPAPTQSGGAAPTGDPAPAAAPAPVATPAPVADPAPVATPAPEAARPSPPAQPPAATPAPRRAQIACSLIRLRRGSGPKVRCTLSSAAAGGATVRLTRAGRTVARASGRVTRGRRLPDLDGRRVKAGEHRVSVVLRPAGGGRRAIAATVRLQLPPRR